MHSFSPSHIALSHCTPVYVRFTPVSLYCVSSRGPLAIRRVEDWGTRGTAIRPSLCVLSGEQHNIDMMVNTYEDYHTDLTIKHCLVCVCCCGCVSVFCSNCRSQRMRYLPLLSSPRQETNLVTFNSQNSIAQFLESWICYTRKTSALSSDLFHPIVIVAACDPFSLPPGVSGDVIVLAKRGMCSFTQKTEIAQLLNAKA